MKRKHKIILLWTLAAYPAISVADGIFYTLTGLSFFHVPVGEGPHGAVMLRMVLTFALAFATFACSQLVDVAE